LIPRAPAISPVVHTRPHLGADLRLVLEEPQQDGHDKAKTDNEQPVRGELDAAQLHRVREDRRDYATLWKRPPDLLHCPHQYVNEPYGQEHLAGLLLVEAPQEAHFEHETERPGGRGPGKHAEYVAAAVLDDR
jgi:hypothetical protein